MGPHSHIETTIHDSLPISTRPPSIPKKSIKLTFAQVADLTDEESQSHNNTRALDKKYNPSP